MLSFFGNLSLSMLINAMLIIKTCTCITNLTFIYNIPGRR